MFNRSIAGALCCALVCLAGGPAMASPHAHAHGASHARVAHHRAHHVRQARHRLARPKAASYVADWPSARLVTEGAPTPLYDGNGAYWQDQRRETGRAGPIESLGSDLVSAMRRVIGMRRQPGFHSAWCGDGLAMVARRAGYVVPAGFSKAANWIHFGRRLPGPHTGAIAVYSHHVAVVTQWPRIVSANFGHKFAEGIQRTTKHQRLLGFVELARI